jgi:hypothetical protein
VDTSGAIANKPSERTHFDERGAKAMAELVMRELPTAAPPLEELKEHVVTR